MTRCGAMVLCGWLAATLSASVHAAVPLRICLQSDDPPLSSVRDGKPAGFDVALGQALAERLHRRLELQWFITRDDPDSNPVTEANALLSDGRCALVAGYPLVADKLGRPRAQAGRLPPFMGAKPEDRRRWINLGELEPTRAYRRDAITVAFAPGRAGHATSGLGDLAGLKVGVEIHGLPDLIAMTYRHGAMTEHVAHFTRVTGLFEQLESGGIDAALVGQRALDAWRVANPTTRVAATAYQHPFGINVGLVGLASERVLIGQVDATLSELLAKGSLGPMAQANGLTYLPPRQPDVGPSMTLDALRGD